MTTEYSILAIGDPHGKISNLHHLNLLAHKICYAIKKYKPNGVVILGDLHDSHERMNVYAWMATNNFLDHIANFATSEAKAWTKYVMGNHDIPSNNLFLEGIHPFQGFNKGFFQSVIVDKPESMETPIGRIAFVPYVPNGRFKEAFDTIETPWHPRELKWYRSIFCHQEFKNADIGSSIISKNGDEWPLDGGVIISGHIHKRQIIQGNIIYVGSPYQTNFGEEENKTISLFTYTMGGMKEELIDLKMPRKKTYETTVEEVSKLKLNDQDENRVSILDSSVAISAFKKSDKYKELQKVAKVIFKPSDKVFVKRDVVKKTFRDLINEYAAKEDDAVKEVFTEVMNASGS